MPEVYMRNSIEGFVESYVLRNNIFVWGTGKYALRLMTELERFKDVSPALCSGIINRISCFVDNDKTKWGSFFYEKEIIDPASIGCDASDVLYVIAMANAQEVVEFLSQKKGFCQGKDFVLFDDFLRAFHWQLADCAMNRLRCGRIGKEIYSAGFVKGWYESNSSMSDFFREHTDFTPAEFVSAIRFLFLDEISDLSKRFSGVRPQGKKLIKTIGLLVHSYSSGGAERVVSHLIPLYVRMGYRVVLFTHVPAAENDYPLLAEISRVIVPDLFSSNAELFFKDFQDSLKEYRVDILCLHIPYEGVVVFYLALLAKLMGIYCIAENHTSFVNFIRQRNGLRNHDQIYRMFDRLIVLSRADRIYWQTLGVHSVYIPNPCNDLSDGHGSNCNFRRNPKTVLWVGRLDQKYKRIFDIVPIMREVVLQIPDAQLFVVGRYAQKEEYETLLERIERYHLKDNIIFCGERKDVSRFYHGVEVMLMTSPGEGFPMVLAEAMSCSLPVVMYDLPYLEIVRNGGGIISVPQRDTGSAAQAIVDILLDVDLREKLAHEARENIEHFINFDLAGAWRKVFSEIASGDTETPVEDSEFAMIEKFLSQ